MPKKGILTGTYFPRDQVSGCPVFTRAKNKLPSWDKYFIPRHNRHFLNFVCICWLCKGVFQKNKKNSFVFVNIHDLIQLDILAILQLRLYQCLLPADTSPHNFLLQHSIPAFQNLEIKKTKILFLLFVWMMQNSENKRNSDYFSLCKHACMYLMNIYIYIYIYIERERERERELCSVD